MTAPKVIWVEPGMPGYTDEPCKDYTKRYTRDDAPELVALVEAAERLRCNLPVAAIFADSAGAKLRADFDAALAAYEGLGK